MLHKSGGDGRCGGSGGKDVTILNQLNIEYHTEIDACYNLHRSGGDGRCGGSGGKDVTILNQLNIEYHTEIDDCYTGLGVTEMWGEWGEGRHNTEPT